MNRIMRSVYSNLLAFLIGAFNLTKEEIYLMRLFISVVLLYAARVFDYFVVIEIAFMDNQAQITETISRLDSEKVR